ncbi:hypothetical protein RhiJN_26668 [Ceratobasidium sp. AG-Ba]|nr:hypothetical protein RhiJN_26668 [Ceratobasidium sp. AG-Ba]
MSASGQSQAHGKVNGTPQGDFELDTRTSADENLLGKGRINPTTPTWQSLNVAVEYENDDQVSGKHPFTGHIGMYDFEMNLSNGVKMSGPLTIPLDKRTTIQGSMTWGSSG